MIEKAKQLLARENVFFRESLSKIFVSLVLVFFFFALAGFVVADKFPEFAVRVFDSIRESYESKGLFDATSRFDLFILIIFNNVVAAVFSLAAGLIPFLFLSCVSVIANGFFLGVIGAVVLSQGKGLITLLLSLLPHGIVELPGFFYASSLGIYLTIIISKKILGRPVSIQSAFIKVFWSFLIIVFPLLFLAAFLEAYVTYAIVKN